ncbi:MAG: 1,4-alpha-glucan branching enzyme, partial [Chitinivibrionales bacterium]|nr:1,4-alpha-glucan branching enzyme [Chitinivibrionales bacterium]MBD3357379.1 1,4-alpha-glucan branching enzyme [Chitinivibrionales bacterium]
NLRLLLGFMFLHPGKKLLFMGGEFGQWTEWNHDTSLDWHLLSYGPHQGLRRWVKDLNHLYRSQPPLYERDFTFEGFSWIDCNDIDNSVVTFIRRAADPSDSIIALCNFTPVPRENYRVGVPAGGYWRELLNSDAPLYGGSGMGNLGGRDSVPIPAHGMYHSIVATAPPLSVTVFKRQPW